MADRRKVQGSDAERSSDEPAPAPDTALTPREVQVLLRIRRLAAKRPEGTVEAGMIGKARTCPRLADLGYITIELDSVGSSGGRYYRYRPVT